MTQEYVIAVVVTPDGDGTKQVVVLTDPPDLPARELKMALFHAFSRAATVKDPAEEVTP